MLVIPRRTLRNYTRDSRSSWEILNGEYLRDNDTGDRVGGIVQDEQFDIEKVK